MQGLFPFFFLVLTVFAFFLNILGLMNVIPLYLTLPILFICIYLTVYSFTNKKVYRGMR
ncbi:hypothetical protein [Oceanobacillus picturae]|uniref:hypothetical protein n=1 Tax=Oceanobacillus picturae TaxID=171693 RepID=UPI000568BF8A|nr:hypothetical protein [Oceanobacillus picturae]